MGAIIFETFEETRKVRRQRREDDDYDYGSGDEEYTTVTRYNYYSYCDRCGSFEVEKIFAKQTGCLTWIARYFGLNLALAMVMAAAFVLISLVTSEGMIRIYGAIGVTMLAFVAFLVSWGIKAITAPDKVCRKCGKKSRTNIHSNPRNLTVEIARQANARTWVA